MPKEAALYDENGVQIAILGVNDDNKVTSISYLGDYMGDRIQEYLDAAGWEMAEVVL